jgi:hypothetical protein
MLNATVNMIFATIFASLAWWSVPRGWNFLKVGWTALQGAGEIQWNRSNSALYFFFAGLGWLTGGIVSAIVAIVMGILTISNFANS